MSRFIASHLGYMSTQVDPLRHTILDHAAYLVRHFRVPDEWVDGLAVPKWNAVASPFRAVNAQDCAEDKLCVRLSST
jgi:hypothetical protein